MWKDPIVEEVRKNRDAIAKSYNYDLNKIFTAARAWQKKSKHHFVSFEPEKTKSAVTGLWGGVDRPPYNHHSIV